jgi:transketolase
MITKPFPNSDLITKLTEHARCMRRHIIQMTSAAGSGHPGPSFSPVEILSALYFQEMKIDPQLPHWPARDRFVLSKGHAAPVLYAALREAGYYSDDVMLTLRQIGSPLQGHPCSKMDGVDATSGSLGIGFSQAVGMALGAKMRSNDVRVYALLGDGECDEGQIWEAALAASHYNLGNLAVFIDSNGYQYDGPVKEVMNLEPLAEKWQAFGWRVEEIDGHSYEEILGFLHSSRESLDKPSVAIARTIKGYGVSFMAGTQEYHARPLTSDEAQRALDELNC